MPQNDKENKKLWSGRFLKQIDPLVEQFNASIDFDQELVYEDILGSLAHANMLNHHNIISTQEHDQLQKGLLEIANNVAQGKISFQIEDEDIHMNIERLLLQNIGEVAGKLHTARSRNDQAALDTHLYLRKQLLIVMQLLIQLQKTLLQLANEHSEIIAPGYTHLQRAQPIYLAQHWLAYVAMLQRDIERLQANWKHINLSPLGACALTGTSLPTNRQYTAELLGFDGIYENTLDAVSDKDFIIEFLSAASLIMLHLSRLSEEIILWSSSEFNFISLDDAFSTGSSIMPQKKNPDVPELARGKTGRVYGALFSLLTIMKGLPLTYNKDMQEDKEPLFDTVKTLKQVLSVYSPLLDSLKINTETLQQAAHSGFLNATALAEYLVKQGMSFRNAHEVTGKLVSFCINANLNLDELPLPEMQKFSSIINQDVFQYINIKNCVTQCNKEGNSEETLLQKQLLDYENKLKVNKTWLLTKQDQILVAYSRFSFQDFYT